MTAKPLLEDYLRTLSPLAGGHDQAVVAAILAITEAGKALAALLASGPLSGDLAAVREGGSHGDPQKELDLMADDLMRRHLTQAPVAVFGSEEIPEPVILNPGAPLAVAIDPLDGSSNIDTNAPIGTIFSILPMNGLDPLDALLQPGRNQCAAGFLIYGVHTALVVTWGAGTHVFTLDPASGQFVASTLNVVIAPTTREYAINGSNEPHWSDAMRRYITDCRTEGFNTRWIASMVADAYRILVRGGVYLYPGDARKGYANGRLRLVYEANPVGFLMEQAGAAATDGLNPILDLVPTSLHQRVPLVFGSTAEVTRIATYHNHPPGDNSPLFGQRGLFRA